VPQGNEINCMKNSHVYFNRTGTTKKYTTITSFVSG